MAWADIGILLAAASCVSVKSVKELACRREVFRLGKDSEQTVIFFLKTILSDCFFIATKTV